LIPGKLMHGIAVSMLPLNHFISGPLVNRRVTRKHHDKMVFSDVDLSFHFGVILC